MNGRLAIGNRLVNNRHSVLGEVSEYYTDFSNYATGVGVPTGWTVAEGNSNWEIVEDVSYVGGKGLKCNEGTVSNHLLWTSIGEVSDILVTARIHFPSTDVDNLRASILLRSSIDTQDFVMHEVTDFGGAGSEGLQIWKRVSGSYTNLADIAERLDYNSIYLYKEQLIGTSVEVKEWLTTESEPVSFDKTATYTERSSGYVGLRFRGDLVIDELKIEIL